MDSDSIRNKIFKYFPTLVSLKRFNKIIPKFLAYIVWPILKPEKIIYDGRIFFTSTKKFSNPSRDLFAYKKLYNIYEKKIIENYLKKNSNCIDVGANIGFFSYLFLKKVGKEGKIFAFEKIPEVFYILKKNFENEQNVICNFGAVGVDKESLIIEKIIDCKIQFIKIDIDGADYFALKSCEQIIKKDRPIIIIELSEASEREHNVNYSKTIEFLLNYDYNIYEIDSQLTKFDRKLKFDEVINLLALNSSTKI